MKRELTESELESQINLLQFKLGKIKSRKHNAAVRRLMNKLDGRALMHHDEPAEVVTYFLPRRTNAGVMFGVEIRCVGQMLWQIEGEARIHNCLDPHWHIVPESEALAFLNKAKEAIGI